MTKLSTKSGLSKRSLAVYTGYKIRNQEVPVEALRKRLLAKKNLQWRHCIYDLFQVLNLWV